MPVYRSRVYVHVYEVRVTFAMKYMVFGKILFYFLTERYLLKNLIIFVCDELTHNQNDTFNIPNKNEKWWGKLHFVQIGVISTRDFGWDIESVNFTHGESEYSSAGPSLVPLTLVLDPR